MSYTPHLPLATPEANPEKIIKKGKASQEGFLAAISGTIGNFPDSTFKTLVTTSSAPLLLFVETPRNLNLEYFPVEYSSFSPQLKEESFEVLTSPNVVSWFRLERLEDFTTLGSPSPPSLKLAVTKEEVASVPLEFPPSSSKTQPLLVKTETSSSYTPLSPKLHIIQTKAIPVKTQSPPYSPRIYNPPLHNPMADANLPRNRMDAIVAVRYAPLTLPQPMNYLPVGDYLRYMPKFTGEENITVEDHLVDFYSYADNLNIENEDVWMRVFV